MNWLYTSAEYVTTAIEILIYFGIIGLFSEKRISNNKHWFLYVFFVVGITCVTKALNTFALYSYLTAVIWIVIIAGAAVCLYKYRYFSSLCIAVVYAVLINVMDLIVLSILEIVFGFAGFTLEVMTSVGIYRCIYVLSMKIIMVLIYWPLARKRIPPFDFDLKTSLIIILSCVFCFLCMNSLLEAVVIGNVADMRRGILVAWLFIVLFIVTIMFLLQAHHKISSGRTANKIIEAQLDTLEQDNKNLNIAYSDLSKITHDFKNHLRTISMLAQNEKHTELKEYLNEVASDVDEIQIVSYTGIDSVDAVINNKKALAKKEYIIFEIDAAPLNHIQIRGSDLCAIIVNLVDNAIEACVKLDEIERRRIRLSISVVNSMLMIKCINNYRANDIQQTEHGDYISTKRKDENHGYGMQIVKAIAEKYNGSFEISREETQFTAVVMLS